MELLKPIVYIPTVYERVPFTCFQTTGGLFSCGIQFDPSVLVAMHLLTPMHDQEQCLFEANEAVTSFYIYCCALRIWFLSIFKHCGTITAEDEH